MKSHLESVSDLARMLETSQQRLQSVTQRIGDYYEQFLLLDPGRPAKVREVFCVRGELRRYQSLLFRKFLRPLHRPSAYSHGGVKGRNIKSNLVPHVDSAFVFTTDIANFYPSIRYDRVYRLFANDFGCRPDVARLCTRICTLRWHLAQGLLSSPILADRLMKQVDRRVGIMCEKHRMVYTRYVDDLIISGPFRIESGSTTDLVVKILGDCGLRVNPEKHACGCGRLSKETYITKLRIKRGRIDVRPEYISEVLAQLANASKLARGCDFVGPYYTGNQIYGRIQFIGWINPGRRSTLMRQFRSVDWRLVDEEARSRGLIVPKKRLVRPGTIHAAQYEARQGLGGN